jgi:alanyl-tRNA synthetase
MDGVSPKDLRGVIDELRNQHDPSVVCLASGAGRKVSLAIGVTPSLKTRMPAGDLMAEVSIVVGGKGGGRPDFAQGGGSDPEKIEQALDRFVSLVKEKGA